VLHPSLFLTLFPVAASQRHIIITTTDRRCVLRFLFLCM
jgi:hypothetical protein